MARQFVEGRPVLAVWIVRRFQSERRGRTDEHDASDSAGAVARQVANDFAAAHRMADERDVVRSKCSIAVARSLQACRSHTHDPG